jgi:radical SAM superfamily enzyme YgiQ (UPF0313 family)
MAGKLRTTTANLKIMDVIFWTGVWGELSRSIGSYQLAHWLRKNAYDCQVIDFVHKFNHSELQSVTERFIDSNTLSIGMSSTFWAEFKDGRLRRTDKIPENLKLTMDALKHKYPNIKFILGGSQVDHLESETIKMFDLIVSGAGEDAFLEFLENLRKNRKQVFSLETRYGTPYKSGSLNSTFDIYKNDHLFADQDCIIEGETLPIEISRGCIFKCGYCQYPYIGKKKLDYIRNFDLVKNEIEHNYKKFKVKNYYLIDDTFNDTPEKMNLWFECIESLDFNIEYTGYLRADLLSRNEYQIEKFKQTGLASAFFGIESFHPTASKMFGKGWSGKEGKTFLSSLKKQWKNDVTAHLSFIVGFPFEVETDYRETQNWCFENKMDSWVWQPLYINTRARLFTSDLDRNPEKYGFEISENGDIWCNSHHTSQSSYQLANQLNAERNVKETQKITSWQMLYYMSMGFDSKTLKNSLIKDINLIDVKMKEFKFFKKYKEKLNSITV